MVILSVKCFLIAAMRKYSFGIQWCVKSQKSEDLIYTAVEGWNLALSNEFWIWTSLLRNQVLGLNFIFCVENVILIQ
jgi:hypothetical protein